MLDLCLSLMDETGESFCISVTLFVGGTIISGDLIHGAAYYRAQAEKLDSLIDKQNSKMFSNLIEEMIRESVEKSKTSDQPEETERDEIHLKNLKILHSPIPITFSNSFMVAFRIDAIDGFVLGRGA